MPTARNPSPKRPVPRLSGASQGGSGGAIRALAGQQEEMQAQFQKLLKAMEKRDQENAEKVAQAAQAGAGAATQVANQVARGMEKQQAASTRERERAEDKDFAVQQQELNAELQKEAAKDAAELGQKLMAHREKQLRYIDRFASEKNEMKKAAAAYHTRTLQMAADGAFSSPEGQKKLEEREDAYLMMQINNDDQYDDRYMEHALDLHNKQLEGSLTSGDPEMSLANLATNPLQLPMAPVQKGGQKLRSAKGVSPEKVFEMKMYGSYPAKGVVFNEEDNLGMPEGMEPTMLTPKMMHAVRARDDNVMVMGDQGIRQEMNRKYGKVVFESLDKLQSLMDTYHMWNKIFPTQAGPAVQEAMQTWLEDEKPTKFNNPPRYLIQESIKEVFGGGEKGGRMALIAMEMYDGKREMKTPEELHIAIPLESALFSINKTMRSEFQGSVADAEGNITGGTFATQMVTELQDFVGEEGTLELLGVPNTEVGLVRAQERMQQILSETWATGEQMHTGFWNGSGLTQMREGLEQFTREADLQAFKGVTESEDAESRANHLLGLTSQEDAGAFISANIDARTTAEVAAQGPVDFSSIGKSLSDTQALIMLGHEVGPNAIQSVTNFAFGNLDAPTSPNLRAYRAQTKLEGAHSGFGESMINVAGFQHDRQTRAKAARVEREAQGAPNITEAAIRGGAMETVPALMRLAGRGIDTMGLAVSRGTVRTVAGLTQMAAGEGATRRFVEGERERGGNLTRAFARGMAPREESNLTEEEREQVLRPDQQQRGPR